jgi:uncharacterized protein (DUF169 family)
MNFDIAKAKELDDRLGFADHALAVFYTDDKPADAIHPQSGIVPREENLKDGTFDWDTSEKIYPCVLAYVRRTRRSGVTSYFDSDHFGCPGGGCYLGLAEMSPMVPYFVSTGKEGLFEGERLVKSPELVRRFVKEWNIQKAPKKYCVIKRIDKLAPGEEPEVLVFFGHADPLSGLMNLVNFASEDWNSVIAPFGAACGTIVLFPLQEAKSEKPRAVLGSFDIAARPFVEPDYMSLALPRPLHDKVLAEIDNAFLNTRSWKRVIKRVEFRRKRDAD